jgi:membrane complex biogenesis BtpA family protein
MKNFWIAKPLIGMIHLDALPFSPLSKKSIAQIYDKAAYELEIYQKQGLQGVMIENMHDVPYQNRKAEPITIAAMTTIATLLKLQCDLPMGIQILAGANIEALSVASAANLHFIRAEAFVFGHLADEGFMNADAAELMRYRKHINAEHIKVFVDIKKKHSSHAISSDISVAEMAKAADFFLADGIIITGASTGLEANLEDIEQSKKAVKLPVWIGSGINKDNLGHYFNQADGFIVGSSLKVNNHWAANVDEKKVKELVDKRAILLKKA